MDEICAAFGRVGHLELRVNLESWKNPDLWGYVNGEILPAFVPGVLREILLVFVGRSSTLQHFLQDPACATSRNSLQQTLLDLSPVAVIFASTIVIDRPYHVSISMEVMLKETFPGLFKHGIAQIVPPESAPPVTIIVALT